MSTREPDLIAERAVREPEPRATTALGARTATSRRRLVAALFVFAVAVGIALRVLQIPDQIIADDEWHPLQVLLDNGYGYIFTHFGACDHCIPLTLYDKLVSDTFGLSEMWMRAPMLVAGIAALIVFPLLLAPYLGTSATLVFTWLLAISPLHVYFSRYARPYAIVLFLVVAGTASLARWWSTGRLRWAAAYAVCAIFAPWFHLAYLPFSLAPLAWVFAASALRARREGRALTALLPRGFWLLAAIVVIGIAALVAPPIATDWDALHSRTGVSRFMLPPPYDVFQLVSGAQRPLLAFASGLSFVLGIVVMLRRQRALLAYFAIVLGAQVLALTISGPYRIEHAIVLVRYALPMLAAFLWVSAVGFVHLDELVRKEWRRAPVHAVTAGVLAALAIGGPIEQSHHTPNNWTNHAMFQFNYEPSFERYYATNVLNVATTSSIYSRIGQLDDPSMRIVEAPWNIEWNAIPYPVYQYLHKKEMLIGFVDDPEKPPGEGELPAGDPRFAFRNFVHVSDLDGMRKRGVRFVLLHRDLQPGPNNERDPRSAAVEHWRKHYLEVVGPPVYEDKRLVVFDLNPRPRPR
jgi:hypothetical protein